jgi:hypothetical protein
MAIVTAKDVGRNEARFPKYDDEDGRVKRLLVDLAWEVFGLLRGGIRAIGWLLILVGVVGGISAAVTSITKGDPWPFFVGEVLFSVGVTAAGLYLTKAFRPLGG